MWIHAVDLDVGRLFADIPGPMLAELIPDVVAAGPHAGVPGAAAGRHRPEARLEARARTPIRTRSRGRAAGAGGLAGRPFEGSGPAHGRRQPAARPPRGCSGRRTGQRALGRASSPGANAPGRRPDFDAVRAEFALPASFPPDVLAEADRAAAQRPGLGPDRVDATDVELVTIDPPGSKDLDQAVGVARRGDGYRVHYAIADLGAFVVPGGAAGHRGAPARADRLPARRLRAAAPAGAVRGRGEPAAGRPRRPCCGRSTWTAPGERRGGRRAPGAWCAPAPGSTTRACRPTSTRAGRTRPSRRCPSSAGCAGPSRCAAARSSWSCPSRRSCPTAPGGWTAVIRRARRRGVERGDLAAHRHGRGADHAGRRCRRAAHAARAGTRRAVDAAAPHRGDAGHRLAGRRDRRRGAVRAAARHRRTRSRCAGPPPRCCAARATPPSTGRGRRATRRPGARGDRRAVRARHRAAAAARRPLRHGGLPAPSPRAARCRGGCAPPCPRCRS